MDCLSGKGHLHHKSCQVEAKDGSYLCPHCGEKSLQVIHHQTYKRRTETQRSNSRSSSSTSQNKKYVCYITRTLLYFMCFYTALAKYLKLIAKCQSNSTLGNYKSLANKE